MNHANNKTKSQRTLRALVGSLVSFSLCLSMFVGSTYAWFTDTATTGVNTIQSGTLDVVLVDGNYATLEGRQLSFKNANGDTDILWEPGCTFTTDAFYVKNNGTLALKYKLVLNGIDGDAKLLEVIEWTVTKGGTAIADLSTYEDNLLPTATSEAIVLSGHMKEDAGKEYQNLTVAGLGITVYATQYTYEYDSNNNQYDAVASLDFVTVSTPEALYSAVANGGNVSVTDDVTIPSRLNITGNTKIQGNGNTITAGGDNRVISFDDNTEPTTLSVSGATLDATGLERGISIYGNTATATLNIDNSTVKSGSYGINVGADNNSVIIDTKNTTVESWGALNIWSPTTLSAENCTLIGTNDKTYNATGWNNFATIVANAGSKDSALTFTNCHIEATQTTGNEQWLVLLRDENLHLTFNNCTFVVDGVEITDVTELIENYFAFTSMEAIETAVITIDGQVIDLT